MTPMHFDDWIQIGMDRGWAGPPVCITHDGLPTTAAEDDTEDDVCIHIVRLYEDATVASAVRENHAPSVWRETNRGR